MLTSSLIIKNMKISNWWQIPAVKIRAVRSPGFRLWYSKLLDSRVNAFIFNILATQNEHMMCNFFTYAHNLKMSKFLRIHYHLIMKIWYVKDDSIQLVYLFNSLNVALVQVFSVSDRGSTRNIIPILSLKKSIWETYSVFFRQVI